MDHLFWTDTLLVQTPKLTQILHLQEPTKLSKQGLEQKRYVLFQNTKQLER